MIPKLFEQGLFFFWMRHFIVSLIGLYFTLFSPKAIELLNYWAFPSHDMCIFCFKSRFLRPVFQLLSKSSRKFENGIDLSSTFGSRTRNWLWPMLNELDIKPWLVMFNQEPKESWLVGREQQMSNSKNKEPFLSLFILAYSFPPK